MFRVGQTMLGIQAHPEFTVAYSEALLIDRIERVGEAKVRAAQLSLTNATDERIVCNWIANFLRV